MSSEKIAAAIVRLESIEAAVDDVSREIGAEDLNVSDRQYVSRCFDLLRMELGAVQQYLRGLG